MDGPGYKPPPVDVGEVLGAWTAARVHGGFNVTGGSLVLSTEWLVFSPWDMDKTRAWLVRGLSWAGVPNVGHVDKLLTLTKLLEPLPIPVRAIGSAHVISGPTLLRPPVVRLTFADRRHFDVGILKSPTTLSISDANRAAAESFVQALAALRYRVAGPPAPPRSAPPPAAPATSSPLTSTPSPPAYSGPVNASPMARSLAMNQLRAWRQALTPDEFATAKARKLAEVGLVAGRPPQTAHTSPMSQQMAVTQANEFASLVAEGVLTQAEYQTVRYVILHENGLA
jgi:hypothetical protein